MSTTMMKSLPKAKREAIQQRHDLIASMPEALRSRCNTIEQMIQGQMDSTVRFHHQLGQHVLEIQDDSETYGANAVKQVAELLPFDQNLLYKARAFAKAYSKAELEELCSLGMGDEGKRLDWTHVVHLLSVEDKKKRKALQEKASETHLTTAELHDLIRKKQGARGKGGAPMKRPETVKGGFVQMRTKLQELSKRRETVWTGDQGIFERFGDMEDAAITDDIYVTATEAKEEAQRLREALDEDIKHLTAVESRCQKSLSNKSQTSMQVPAAKPKPTSKPAAASKAGKAAKAAKAARAAKAGGNSPKRTSRRGMIAS